MRVKVAVCFAVVIALFGLPVVARMNVSKTQQKPSIDRRVDELLSQMTIEEKVGQLNQLFYFKQFMKPEVVEPGIREGKSRSSSGSTSFTASVLFSRCRWRWPHPGTRHWLSKLKASRRARQEL
jgi:hypothetical protein